MQRLLMAAGSILLLTSVAHPQPLPHRAAHPAAFILADDDDSGSADDASAIDNADEDSSATSDEGVTDNGGEDQGPDANAIDNADEDSSATSDEGVTNNGGGDQGPDANDASATDNSAEPPPADKSAGALPAVNPPPTGTAGSGGSGTPSALDSLFKATAGAVHAAILAAGAK